MSTATLRVAIDFRTTATQK